jgi:formate dehydrogenase gamma subunit
MRPAMMIELDRCVGCQACVSACKARWGSGPGAARDWVLEFERGNRQDGLELTFYPGLCMQCEGHPCTTECPTGATYADDEGIVVVDRDVCIGCGNCVPLCPYAARRVDPTQGIVEKCNLCAPYVRGGGTPACVATCLAECRHYGDLDDPEGDLQRRIRARDARPLETEEIRVGAKTTYAPATKREHILASGAVRMPASSALTRVWQGATRPAAQLGVPAVAAAAVLGGLLVDFRNRGRHDPARSASTPPGHADASAAPADARGAEATPDANRRRLPRHTLGMRLLHWFNAASWVWLLVSGTALMATPAFALFGTRLPAALARAVGGPGHLIALHVVWGLLWALVIVPGFLAQKRGGLDALRETWLTRDDVRWLLYKPMVMLGVGERRLPPQDKYNAGQKLFALSVLAATAIIIGSGVVMTFHLGGAPTVAMAILAHKLGIMLVLAGLGVHLTMAVVMREERPALRAMVQGDIDREHAETHAEKWVAELERHAGRSTPPEEE